MIAADTVLALPQAAQAVPAAVLAAGKTLGGPGEAVTFWILAPLMVIAALGMLVSRKAVHSALFLAFTMIGLAILYLAQDAPFLGTVQIVVYTGAVMMLFVFVLMIVGVDSSDSLVETLRGQRVAAVLVALAFGILVVAALGRAVFVEPVGLKAVNAAAGGNVHAVSELIFGRYVFAFEVLSALLITAALGAMVLAHRERFVRRVSQRELSEARFRPGGNPQPLPAPGTYARHNAVDTPALLPDGTPAELSVADALRARGDGSRPERVEIEGGGK